eukprot:CAMPEP_0179092436 /NCGR_PEP_ID=MMETSP0796-20121207/42276_1 /TAXON_ID=73915 /ORGANISM="Pyrodinium bahamense, Strain pbaha01" /LENGTH=245 /DNA_ID=CAMNT_0020790041 /DNA_START=108 /DNA_END=846 /DNA_ORIENTATION=+
MTWNRMRHQMWISGTAQRIIRGIALCVPIGDSAVVEHFRFDVLEWPIDAAWRHMRDRIPVMSHSPSHLAEERIEHFGKVAVAYPGFAKVVGFLDLPPKRRKLHHRQAAHSCPKRPSCGAQLRTFLAAALSERRHQTASEALVFVQESLMHLTSAACMPRRGFLAEAQVLKDEEMPFVPWKLMTQPPSQSPTSAWVLLPWQTPGLSTGRSHFPHDHACNDALEHPAAAASFANSMARDSLYSADAA